MFLASTAAGTWTAGVTSTGLTSVRVAVHKSNTYRYNGKITFYLGQPSAADAVAVAKTEAAVRKYVTTFRFLDFVDYVAQIYAPNNETLWVYAGAYTPSNPNQRGSYHND